MHLTRIKEDDGPPSPVVIAGGIEQRQGYGLKLPCYQVLFCISAQCLSALLSSPRHLPQSRNAHISRLSVKLPAYNQMTSVDNGKMHQRSHVGPFLTTQTHCRIQASYVPNYAKLLITLAMCRSSCVVLLPVVRFYPMHRCFLTDPVCLIVHAPTLCSLYRIVKPKIKTERNALSQHNPPHPHYVLPKSCGAAPRFPACVFSVGVAKPILPTPSWRYFAFG